MNTQAIGHFTMCALSLNPLTLTVDTQALWRSALSVRVPGSQKLQMTAKTRSGTGCLLIAVPIWQQWVSKRFNIVLCIVTLIPSGLPSWILFNLYWIKGALLFVLVSFFWLRVLDKAKYSAFESTLKSSVASHRIVCTLSASLYRLVAEDFALAINFVAKLFSWCMVYVVLEAVYSS